jgi:hypothetical protein
MEADRHRGVENVSAGVHSRSVSVDQLLVASVWRAGLRPG